MADELTKFEDLDADAKEELSCGLGEDEVADEIREEGEASE